jgi:hypothetical protein
MTFSEIVPLRRLVLTTRADFIPGVEPYPVDTALDLFAGADAVRLVLTLDAMHDDHWTKMATMGWESQLDKLGARLRAHA